ncbi:MAG: endopeptidase La [Bacilli bacterium]|nr:endopeptidase La [Bacilli bacterium]
MLKTKLPVIVLRNIVLLPLGEIKLEVQEVLDKEIIYNAINEHNGYVLLVSPKYATTEILTKEDLPKIGIIGKITSNFELPNTNIRISITGINRAFIYDYIQDGDLIKDAIIGPQKVEQEDSNLTEAKLRLIKEEFSKYVSVMPSMSNYYVNKINEEKSLENITDSIINILPISFEEKYKFLEDNNSISRGDYLITLLQKERNISSLENDLENKLKIKMDESQREFVLREKLKVIKKELHEDTSKEDEIDLLNKKIASLKMDNDIKERLYKEVKKYENTPIASPELTISKNYLDTMLSLPWNVLTKDETNLDKIEKCLNETHYGLNDIKTRILEYIAVKKLTNEENAPILCLVGPPGVGKTTLAFSIAKALNKNFVKISVGGVSDQAEIVGHRRTYVGAEPGRIINGMIKAKSSNPLFLIDEIDKMTKGFNGDPESAMLEVLDREQNKYFTDNFLEEKYDLSKVMFVLTANDIGSIPGPLLDRLEIIELSSYTRFEKLDIVKKHMLPKLIKNHGLSKYKIVFTDEAINSIIENYSKEAGVRELERLISKILRKIAVKVLNKEINEIEINNKNLSDFIGKEKYLSKKTINKLPGVVNGLAYTPFGGSTLPIEVCIYPGKGNIILTGSLGEVMKESANISIGYVKSILKDLKVKEDFFEKHDIHINATETAVKKEGPSAGIALTTAIISSLKNVTISSDIAMTGEITLMGNVLEIGGLKEKTIGAYNSNVKKIFIPKSNDKDLEELPKEVKDNIKIILVDNYKDIYKELFK